MQRRVVAFLGLLTVVALVSINAAIRFVPPSGAVMAPGLDGAVQGFIMRHPEVVIESVARLQAQQQQAQRGAPNDDARAAIMAHRAELMNDPTSQSIGNPSGDVTLVLFFDYRCPYCKQGVTEEQALLSSDPNLKIVYKEFPILGPQSITASRAALASVRQGKYIAFHDAMMASHGAFADEDIFSMAQDAGIDVNRLLTDMNGDDITAILRANFALAQSLGINGTPAYVVGGRLLGGMTSAADFKQLVAEARMEQAAGTARP